MHEDLAVILPAYKEENRIQPTLREWARYCVEKDVKVRMIIVDDGSPDRTIERALVYRDRFYSFEVVRLQKNTGKWAAIREGIRKVSSGPILITDADGSVAPHHLSKLRTSRGVAASGSRFMKGSTVEGKGLLRRIVSRGYRAYVKAWYRFGEGYEKISDPQCPWKYFWREDLNLSVMQEDRFAGDVEFFFALDAQVINVPVHFVHMRGGSINTRAMFGMLWRTPVVSFRAIVRSIKKKDAENAAAKV